MYPPLAVVLAHSSRNTDCIKSLGWAGGYIVVTGMITVVLVLLVYVPCHVTKLDPIALRDLLPFWAAGHS